MAFQDYQTSKNLGELSNALDFSGWYRRQQAAQKMAQEEEVRKSQGEGLRTLLEGAGRVGVAAITGNPLALFAPDLAGRQYSDQNYLNMLKSMTQPAAAQELPAESLNVPYNTQPTLRSGAGLDYVPQQGILGRMRLGGSVARWTPKGF